MKSGTKRLAKALGFAIKSAFISDEMKVKYRKEQREAIDIIPNIAYAVEMGLLQEAEAGTQRLEAHVKEMKRCVTRRRS